MFNLPTSEASGEASKGISSNVATPSPGETPPDSSHKIAIEPTDGRTQYEWKTCYPREAVLQIRCEGFYLFFVLVVSLFLIFTCWHGILFENLALSPNQLVPLRKYTFYAASGMLGGVVFGIKFFYRVVARGYWHQDRRIWRIMSPFLAMILAFATGVLIDANLFAIRGPSSTPAFVSIGFLTGYFADQANAKMCEIAAVIFGQHGNKN